MPNSSAKPLLATERAMGVNGHGETDLRAPILAEQTSVSPDSDGLAVRAPLPTYDRHRAR